MFKKNENGHLVAVGVQKAGNKKAIFFYSFYKQKPVLRDINYFYKKKKKHTLETIFLSITFYLFSFPNWLSIPTIDHQIFIPSHKLRILGTKKQHSISCMLRFQHPFQAITRLVKLLYLLYSHVVCLTHHRCCHRPWRHTMNSYSMLTQLITCTFHQRQHPTCI